MKNESFYLTRRPAKDNQNKRIKTKYRIPANEYNNYPHACETQKKGSIKIGDRFRLNDKKSMPGQTGLYLEIKYSNPNAIPGKRKYEFNWIYCRVT